MMHVEVSKDKNISRLGWLKESMLNEIDSKTAYKDKEGDW